MTERRLPQPAGAILLVGLAVAILACGPGGAVSSSPSTSAPPSTGSPSTSPPPSGSLEPIDVDTATSDQDRLDGSRVAVRGFILIEANRARMCSLVLESYPPQCGGSTLEIRGSMPPAILGQLDSTADEPDLNQASWGDVIVSGTLTAAGPDGNPVLDLDEMTVVRPS
jgi:hypothetical protein